MSLLRVGVALGVLSVTVMNAERALAEDAGAPVPVQESRAEVDARPTQIRQLISGTLDVAVAPQSLFDVQLSDERALQVEATRLRTLLAALKTPLASDSSSLPTGSASGAVTPPAVSSTTPPDLGSPPLAADAELWKQRLELDETRLAFYALGAERRGELLRAHSARQSAELERQTRVPGQRVDVEREQALAAAKLARAEAERLVGEEVTRLTLLEKRLGDVKRRFEERRGDLALRKDLVFGWQRRVRDIMGADTLAADATYDGLHRQLRSSRDELVAALGELDGESEVPVIGADVLAGVPVDVSTEAARERRLAVERLIASVREDEVRLRDERCATLLDEITVLNRERLDLLPYLTVDKREALTGLTAASWEQALAEVKHLSLILRFHQHVASGWLSSLRSGDTGAVSPWATAALVVPLIGAVLVFVWGRRRTRALLRLADIRLATADRSQHRTTQSPGRYFFRLMLAIHRPLEWMLLFTVIFEILPKNARDLVEVQLLSSVIIWFLVGALVVNVINALASGRADVLAAAGDTEEQLRLRSLRFVAGTIVIFGLTLVLSARLVGEGTIYSWVSSTAWFAIIPVFLVLVRWWRGTVFQRLDKIRKKTPLQAWLLANRSGWQSFLAAMVGALQLFSTGTLRVARSWISDFDVARRVHAYLFKREIERLKEGLSLLEPLSEPTLNLLHPEQPVSRWIECPVDEVLDALKQRCADERGGIVAVHGPRGMGKSSLLRALAAHAGEGAALVQCCHRTSLEEIRHVAQRVSAHEVSPATGRLVLLDEAQTLIESKIGGLTHFDEIIAWMRSSGDGITWVLAMDSALWALLQRARDSRPLFDECHRLLPWRETQIGELLEERCERAQISPLYEDLLDKLPAGADEIDRQEALDAKRAGYQRMLWDHVGGNPGLALQAWRASLARDASGNVRVRSLQTPDFGALEALPDASLFVLRAVLQLAPAAVGPVAEATRLRPDEVLVDFRFGKSQGYFEEVDGRMRVAWPWLGAVTRLLERRRLLVSV